MYFQFLQTFPVPATNTKTHYRASPAAVKMADEEQFSLCWNNFNSNLSAGFHESLCRGDLVDVTLAAEGQLVKAHRLVLSVCSPYFRKMFTQMPANQHAFVFLKDVSHTALKDLIQFMYCGEVNVKQDALPTFISTAEALQIKGLTETVSIAFCVIFINQKWIKVFVKINKYLIICFSCRNRARPPPQPPLHLK